jgi:hypothetical protein
MRITSTHLQKAPFREHVRGAKVGCWEHCIAQLQYTQQFHVVALVHNRIVLDSRTQLLKECCIRLIYLICEPSTFIL